MHCVPLSALSCLVLHADRRLVKIKKLLMLAPLLDFDLPDANKFGSGSTVVQEYRFPVILEDG
jgi:hypothetical protein